MEPHYDVEKIRRDMDKVLINNVFGEYGGDPRRDGMVADQGKLMYCQTVLWKEQSSELGL